jgi:ADP-heptose:LPS heptosyltransferase
VNLSGKERVLVIKPSSLGDIVHTLPAVAAIRRAFPETTIDWLVNTEWTPLLDGSTFLDRTIAFPRREFRGVRGLLRAKRWARENLQRTDYDLAIDFQGLLRSALLARLSSAPSIVGFAESREGAHCLYGQSICVQGWQETHAVDRNLELVHSLGIETTPVEFPLPPGEAIEMPTRFREGALLLHPFSRGIGKSLSIAEVLEFCDRIAPTPVWLVGVGDEPETGTSLPENVLNLINQTSLSQLIHLLREAAWIVSVDSGPMHLAAGITDRVLSIHSWSDPLMVGPWPPEAWIWRDSRILQRKDIRPGQFPEMRSRRNEMEARRLLDSDDIEALAEFTMAKLSE